MKRSSHSAWTVVLFGLLLFVLCCSCSSKDADDSQDQDAAQPAKSAPATPEETLLRMVCNSIAKNDYSSFQRATITAADFALEAMNISSMQASQSYVGSSLRPTQRQKQKEQFDKAAAGGPGLIDFANSTFVGVGSLIESGNEQSMPKGSYAYNIYSVKIETNGQTIDTKDMFPKFKIVTWKGSQRLMRLVYE